MGQLNLRVLIQAVDRATGPIRKVVRALKIELPSASKIAGGALKSLTRLAARAGQVIGTMAGLSFAALTVGVIRTGAAFESYLATLETAEGSSQKARLAMSWVERFAKTTPYDLAQVTEAYIALRNYGIDPTTGSLTSVGNAASAMNKSVMQGVEALADAQTGEFERLKEFGIRARAESGSVRFTYMKDGKEMTVSAKNNAAAINAALLGIFDARFAGAMDRQSRTLNGLWSNLMDGFTAFQRQIADAGVFDYLKGELQTLLGNVDQMAANGRLAAWAKQISAALIELAKTLKQVVSAIDWAATIRGASDFLKVVMGVTRALGGLNGILDIFAALLIGRAAIAIWVAVKAVLGLNAAMYANPIGLVIAGIAGLVFAGWWLYRNWDKVVGFIRKAWSGLVGFFTDLGVKMKAAFKGAIKALWMMVPPWLRMIFRGASFALRVVGQGLNGGGPGGGNRPPAAPRPAVGPQRSLIGGSVDVRIRGDGRPTVSAVRSSNAAVPVTASTYRGGYAD